jgi:hypothetical protein
LDLADVGRVHEKNIASLQAVNPGRFAVGISVHSIAAFAKKKRIPKAHVGLRLMRVALRYD